MGTVAWWSWQQHGDGVKNIFQACQNGGWVVPWCWLCGAMVWCFLKAMVVGWCHGGLLLCDGVGLFEGDGGWVVPWSAVVVPWWAVAVRWCGAFAAHGWLLLCDGVGHLLHMVGCCPHMVWAVAAHLCWVVAMVAGWCHGVRHLLHMVGCCPHMVWAVGAHLCHGVGHFGKGG